MVNGLSCWHQHCPQKKAGPPLVTPHSQRGEEPSAAVIPNTLRVTCSAHPRPRWLLDIESHEGWKESRQQQQMQESPLCFQAGLFQSHPPSSDLTSAPCGAPHVQLADFSSHGQWGLNLSAFSPQSGALFVDLCTRGRSCEAALSLFIPNMPFLWPKT